MVTTDETDGGQLLGGGLVSTVSYPNMILAEWVDKNELAVAYEECKLLFPENLQHFYFMDKNFGMSMRTPLTKTNELLRHFFHLKTYGGEENARAKNVEQYAKICFKYVQRF